MVKPIVFIALCGYIAAAQLGLSAPENPCKLTESDVARLALYHPAPECSTTKNLPAFQGEAVFKLEISKTGAVTGVSVFRSSGLSFFDACGMATVKKWRFRPLPDGCKGLLVHIPFAVRPR